MSLSSHQRHCLDQMGVTVWRSRALQQQEHAELHWLAEPVSQAEPDNSGPDTELRLLLICPQPPVSSLPEQQWLKDLLKGLRVPAQHAAWSLSEQAAADHQPRWLLTLPDNWPAAAAKRALWHQAQAQFSRA